MAIQRSNHVFKGHKALLGGRFVTYKELELHNRFEEYPKSKNGFDWGVKGSGSLQLAYAILRQVSTADIAKENAEKYVEDIIMHLNSRDWLINSNDVLDWIAENSEIDLQDIQENYSQQNDNFIKRRSIYTKEAIVKKKTNVVKEICKELGITQKALANILEVPEGTVSSWAVKNDIPRLGKKAIEFYIQSTKNQQIIDSYKNFVRLLDLS